MYCKTVGEQSEIKNMLQLDIAATRSVTCFLRPRLQLMAPN
jgi:hypothetical protein